MNLGRFHAMICSIRTEMEDCSVITLLDELVSALSQSLSQPDPDTSQNFKEKLLQMSAALEACPSNEEPPTRRRIIEQIGAHDKIGLGLMSRINNILQKSRVIPGDAVTELKALISEVKKFYSGVAHLDQNLSAVDAEYDDLDFGEHEIGVSVPTGILHSNLTNIEKELHWINDTFKVFTEVATGGVSQFSLRTISSSSIEVFVSTVPGVALCVAVAIERIVDLHKKQLEIKKIKLEIEHLKIPNKVSKPFDDHVKDVVAHELDAIAGDLIKKYYKKKDPARKNELTTHLRKILQYMAQRVDKGASFEVRTGLPDKPDESEVQTGEQRQEYERALKKYDKDVKTVGTINALGRAVGRLAGDRQEILMLPRPYEPEDVTGELQDSAPSASDPV